MSRAMERTYRIDMDAPLVMQDIGTLLAEGDQDANRVTVHLTDAGKSADLTGCTGAGYFRRSDGNMVVLHVTVDGSSLTTVFPQPCYAYPGPCQIILQLTDSAGMVRTVLWLTGRVQQRGDGGYIDPGERLPTLAELMEQIAALNTQVTALKQSRVNLLDNPDFAIAQAGYEGYHGKKKFAADRWEQTVYSTFSVSGDVKTLTSTNGYNYISQILWNDSRDNGKSYTLAVELEDGTVKVCAGMSPKNGVTSQTIVGNISFGNDCSLMILKNPDDTLVARLDVMATGASVSFKHLMLFEGTYNADTLPAFEPPDYALELVKCRLYRRQSFSGAIPTASGAVRFVPNRAVNTTQAISWETPMRGIPTVTVMSWGDKKEGYIRQWDTSTDVAIYDATYINEYGFSIRTTEILSQDHDYALHYVANCDM